MPRSGLAAVQQIAKALEDSGVIADVNDVTRLVIDLRAGHVPVIHVEQIGDDRLIDIAKLLTDAEVKRPAVRYWVQVSDELMQPKNLDSWPPFLRPIRRDNHGVPPDSHSHWWLFEDDEAPPAFDGKRMTLMLHDDGTVTRTVL